MGGKNSSIGGRISPQLRERLDAIHASYGTHDSGMLEDALTALADYVELNGGYFRPIKMVRGAVVRPVPTAIYGVNEADDSLLVRLQVLIESEAAKRRAVSGNPPRG